MSESPEDATEIEDLYLDLLKKSLTRTLSGEQFAPIGPLSKGFRSNAYRAIRKLLTSRQLELVRKGRFDPKQRAEGLDWPFEGETMVGLRRLDNLQFCIKDVVDRGVVGDLIETGAWRGGAAIFMRAVLKVCRSTDRRVWVADSFAGLPKPDPTIPQDRGDRHWTFDHLAVSLGEVKENFRKYGMLDDQVQFLAGWFSETLPSAPIDRLAILRLDGDMYQSTMDALRPLYPKLSAGGYVIVDDYGAVAGCRAAVDDYRTEFQIGEEPEWIDGSSVYWQRQG